ncbi:C13 family peptidase [Hydrogenophaga sp. PAMC20947]|uniref:C13 family peptidase n=1 Tax=Hydrogenophaga sp. PAMC20947 TaxID=2565558 RepID=UPI00109DEA70|nr:C13 family peptidase [Hydrogenophaga sp. PAMC20947]QCB46757.1 hypothetical protein E5678_12420 [Hydrogenophaga sp. PAMC20947]
MLCAFALYCAIDLGTSRLAYPGEAVFSLWGWLYDWAGVGIWLLALGWWFALGASHKQHPTPVAAWLTLSWVAVIPMQLVGGAITLWAMSGHYPAALNSEEGRWMVYGALVSWSALTNWRIAQALMKHQGLKAALVISAVAIGILSSFWLRSSAWEAQHASNPNKPILELSQAVFEGQQALFQSQTDAVLPSDGDTPQVYALIYAPYEQDVFLRESKMVGGVLASRFGTEGRTLTLVNHPQATKTQPWATPANLERAVTALADKMNRDRDVLVMYLTSHGGKDHRLASSHWPLSVPELTAEAVRKMLDKAGILYRVVGVSACYSGGWIDPLKEAHTLVMTAADKDHTSYGCGALSELTFFGRAMFDEALRSTRSFEQAFSDAVPRIRQRETDAGKDDGFSNPQIAVGAAFRAHWATQVQGALDKAPAGAQKTVGARVVNPSN